MRRTLTWLVTLPFAAASVVLGHAIAYDVTGTPTGGMHDYLAHAPQVVFILASLAVLGLAADSRARRHSPVPLAVLGIGAFVAQEHLERLIHTGHMPFLFASPVLWLGIALQLPLAVAIWFVARRLAEDIATPSASHGAPRSTARSAARPARSASRRLGARRGLPGARPSRHLLTPYCGAHAGVAPTTSGDSKCALHSSLRSRSWRSRSPSPAPTASAAVKPVVISIKAVNGRPVGGIKRPTVKKGQTVRIVVRTNVGSEVHLHGYNLEKKIKKGVPTVIQFVAKVQGRFELELHPIDALLAQLTVK